MRNESEIIDGINQNELLVIAKEIPIEVLNEVSIDQTGIPFNYDMIIKPTVIRCALVLCERRGII